MTPRSDRPPRPPLTDAEITLLFGRILELATRYALLYLGADDADDSAHLVATKVVEACIANPNYLDEQGPINRFIYECTSNRIKNSRRSRRRRAKYDREHLHDQQDSVHVWADPDAAQLGEETERVVGLALSRMPPRMRLIYTQVRETKLTYEAIGAQIGIGVGTVHTQLSRAIALIRRITAEYRSEGIISLEHHRRRTGQEPPDPQKQPRGRNES